MPEHDALSLSRFAVGCVLCVALGAVMPRGAAAQAAGDFERGLAALQAGRHDEAAAAFEAAYARDRQPIALINLGIACTNLGRFGEAIAALQRYLIVAHPVREARNISAVRSELARLRQLAPTVQPSVPALVPAALPTTAPDVREQPPAPAPASAAPTRTTTPREEQASDKPHGANATLEAEPPCALGDTCLGPTLDLGLPNVIGGGFQLRFGKYFGAGLDFQVLPSISIDVASASASLFSVDGRVYPFGGAFFLAGGFAYQSIHGTVNNGTIAAEASVGVPAVLFGIGFMGHDGLVLGIDLGLVFPLAGTKVDVKDLSDIPMGSVVTQAAVEQARKDAKDGVKQILEVLPVLVQLNLVRVGYLF
jgi:hypothetical protein